MLYKITDPNGKEVFSIESNDPTKSTEGVLGAIVFTILVPYIAMAIIACIAGTALAIDGNRCKKMFEKFSEKNKDIVIRISKLLTNSVNQLLAIKKPIDDTLNKIRQNVDRLGNAHIVLEKWSFNDICKTVSQPEFISGLIKSAKTQTGVKRISMESIELGYVEVNGITSTKNILNSMIKFLK